MTFFFMMTLHREDIRLSICVGVVIPPAPAFPAPAILPMVPVGVTAHAGLPVVVVEVAALPVEGERVGSVGIEPDPRVAGVGNTLGSGTDGVELTPRLPIS